MFKPSDKVVCVDDKYEDNPIQYNFNKLPVLNEIYVVRGLSNYPDKLAPGILLVGIHTDLKNPLGDEVGFWHWRFRKLEEIQEENRNKNTKEAEVTV